MRSIFRALSEPRGVRLRLALKPLGPFFVKFGQVFRRAATLPADLADELAKLQDRVPPFPVELAGRDRACVRQTDRESFREIRAAAVASASVARCISPCSPAAPRRRSRSCGGNDAGDSEGLALMDTGAGLVERFLDRRQALEAP